jgi:hypothetical protein
MSSLPSAQEAQMLAQVLKKAELETKNKLAAREHLLRIQLLLAKRTS